MGVSGSKSDESALFYSDNETENNKFAAVVSTALERNSMDQNYSLYEDLNMRNIQNALKFHTVCGKNIKFPDKKRSIAERDDQNFCEGIVFSERPVAPYERIYVKILKLSPFWNGMIRFGYTSVNPSTHRKTDVDTNNNCSELIDLPKYVYPDLTNKNGYWAASMPEGAVKELDVIFFYFNSFGEIHYGVNDKYAGIFLTGIDVCNRTTQQAEHLWAVIDVYGNTLAIELSNSIPMQPGKNENVTVNKNYQHVDQMNSIASTSSSLSNESSNYSSTPSNSSASSSSLITVIPNHRLKSIPQKTVAKSNQPPKLPDSKPPKLQRNPNTDGDEKLDRLLVSFRRLCVDNHLNETLHDSRHVKDSYYSIYSDPQMNESEGRNYSENQYFNPSKVPLFPNIPILFHEANKSNTAAQTSDIFQASSLIEPIRKFLPNIHGRNVKLVQPDSLIAYRDISVNTNPQQPTTNAYIFLNQPILQGRRSFCLQVLGIDHNIVEQNMSLSIGCTTCDPSGLSVNDLPSDSNLLIDRAEYWIIYKNFFHSKEKNLSIADELCFTVDEQTGNLNFSINGNLITTCLFSVDLTQKLWFFFDLCGRVNGIRIIECCDNQVELNSRVNKTPENFNTQTINAHVDTPTVHVAEKLKRSSRPVSALIEFYRSQLNCDVESDVENGQELTVKKNKEKRRSFAKEECRICWENPIECVLYSCGHMCLCWNW